MARISRPKLTGFGRHEGVLLPNGKVVHIAANIGVQVCDYEAFCANEIVRIEVEVPRQFHDMAITRIQALLRENAPYDLIANNCEIFARKAILEPPASPQVAFWVVAGLAAGAYALSAQ
jgi:hypothetical protein